MPGRRVIAKWVQIAMAPACARRERQGQAEEAGQKDTEGGWREGQGWLEEDHGEPAASVEPFGAGGVLGGLGPR